MRVRWYAAGLEGGKKTKERVKDPSTNKGVLESLDVCRACEWRGTLCKEKELVGGERERQSENMRLMSVEASKLKKQGRSADPQGKENLIDMSDAGGGVRWKEPSSD